METKDLVDEYLMCMYNINVAGNYDFETKKLNAVRGNEIIKELGGDAVAMPLINAEGDRRDEEYLNNFNKDRLDRVVDNWLKDRNVKSLCEDLDFMDTLPEEVKELLLERNKD